MDKVKMGKFLAKLRNDKNLRQQDEAEIFQVSPQAISKWESGESVPDIGTLEKLSNFFKVGIDEIINGEIKNPNANISTVVVARNPSMEERGIGKPYYGAFIYCMSAIVVCFVLGFLPYIRFIVGSVNEVTIYLVPNFYETLFKVSSYVTIFAWLCALTFLSSALLSIGLWLSPNSRRAFWNASFWLALAHMVLNLILSAVLISESNSSIKGTFLIQPGAVLFAFFSIVYFVLFLTLPITRKRTFCPKENKTAAVVNQ